MWGWSWNGREGDRTGVGLVMEWEGGREGWKIDVRERSEGGKEEV